MSASESPEALVKTVFGWATPSIDPPKRHDLYWLKEPEKSVWTWDGDGWFRIDPPERPAHDGKELPHG